MREVGAFSHREDGIILRRDDPGRSNKQTSERFKIKASLAHVYLIDLVKDRTIRFKENERRKRTTYKATRVAS